MEKSKQNQDNLQINNEYKKYIKAAKTNDSLNTSNATRDVGMNDIIDQIGNLMKKFANEVNLQKEEASLVIGIFILF